MSTPRSRRLFFWRMMAQHGVEPLGADWRGSEAMIARALALCAACRSTQACRRWLREPHGVNDYAPFCPNGTAIEACRILDPSAAPPPETRAPGLAELLDDALVRQVMDADHVARGVLDRLLRRR